MQRTISAILMAIGTLVGILILVREIVIGKANNYRFYLMLVGLVMLFGSGWYNYYKNRPIKETKITD
ncbi:MAG: hypothetical protein ABSC53_09660 [Bacteroidota bacterium]